MHNTPNVFLTLVRNHNKQLQHATCIMVYNDQHACMHNTNHITMHCIPQTEQPATLAAKHADSAIRVSLQHKKQTLLKDALVARSRA
jgi:uncharacterized protein (DUF2141 family)